VKNCKALTEGYIKEKKGSVILSGKWNITEGLACKMLTESVREQACTGEADIIFSSITEKAKDLIKENWELEYKENEEAYIIDIDDIITIYADTERAKLYATVYLLRHYQGSVSKAVIYNYPKV